MTSFLNSIRRAVIKMHRKSLSRAIFKMYDGCIQRGPFKGMTYSGEANISDAAHGLKIFGLYEAPLLEKILSEPTARCFIDIGAGDGYYPVGLTAHCEFERAIAFERTESGRDAIKRNAAMNGVSDLIEIHGEVTDAFHQQAQQLMVNWRETIVLIDIEGFEFELLNDSVLEVIRGAKLIIELHDGPNAPDSRRADLMKRLEQNWDSEILADSARDWGPIEDLKHWHDLDRALVFSEGRKLFGEWLIASPK